MARNNEILIRVAVDQEKLDRLDDAEQRFSKAYLEMQEALVDVRNAVHRVANGLEGSAVLGDG